MRPLRYLVRTTLKNQLLALVKKPSRLIYTIFLLALLAAMLAAGGMDTGERDFRDMNELVAVALALYTGMFVMTVLNGFSRGGSLFSLSDATLLFTAPLRPQSILFYGLLRQMSLSFMVGFFLLFQYPNVHRIYGATLGQMLGLLAGYGAAVFAGQVGAMLLYAFSCRDEKRKLLCRVGLLAVYGACLAYLAVRALAGPVSGLAARAAAAAGGGFLYAVPVSGWLGLAVKGVLTGGGGLALQGLGLTALAVALLVFLLFRVEPDFYEDVLKSAELSYSAIAAKKEGTMQEALPARIKVGRTGLGGGWGASAFFRKHLIEDRRSKKFLLSGTGLIFAVVAWGFALFTKDAGLLPAFAMATYLQLFSAMTTGRFNYELTRPYLYLTPEPALKKLLWALAQTLPAMAAEAAVVMVPVGLILGLSPLEILAVTAARMTFGIAYLAADVAVERIFGGSASKILVMLLYIGAAIAVMAPGVILASVGGIGWGLGMAGVLLAMMAGNLLMSLLVFFLCRNLLQYAELSNQ